MTDAATTQWRFATITLLVLMCLASTGMIVGLATYGNAAARDLVIRFALVAAFPFAWAGVVRVLQRKAAVSPAALFGLTTVVFIAFVGAVDFANGRPPYSWVTSLIG